MGGGRRLWGKGLFSQDQKKKGDMIGNFFQDWDTFARNTRKNERKTSWILRWNDQTCLVHHCPCNT